MKNLDQSLFEVNSPIGDKVYIPVSVDDKTDIYTQLQTGEEIKQYFDDWGYVVVRNIIPVEILDKVKVSFNREVKSSDRFIYRQASANPERHKFSQYHFMLNSILNPQSMDNRFFDSFRSVTLDILTNLALVRVLRTLIGEQPKLAQSMYFEGNPATWAHQDAYYLDSEYPGTMVAAWVAVEDIQPGAGRFYIYPGSHKIDLQKNGGDFDIAFHHDRYKQLIKDIIPKFKLECVAPAMRKGDVLFWHGKTIHGSLETTQPEYSRSSFTAHYIPESKHLLQYQSHIREMNLRDVNGVSVNFKKDLNSFKNRLIFSVETTFPHTFRLAKKIAIKMVTK